MEFPFGYHQEAHTYGMNHEVKFTWHYRGMLNKLSLRKMLKAHPDFNDYYITLNELDVSQSRSGDEYNKPLFVSHYLGLFV